MTLVSDLVPSRTAYGVARRRAAHQVLDRPVVFDDPLALRIAGISESDISPDDPRERHELSRMLRAFLAARSRFVEESDRARDRTRHQTGRHPRCGSRHVCIPTFIR
jgi:O-methyltransferase involved in polyketide biosynthesis